ncbi:hypothetical protein ACOME3_004106 [Neoechinorhynchus agilis]
MVPENISKNIFLITGVPGCGKTTVVRKVVEHLEKIGCSTLGMVSDEVRLNGRRIGFDLNCFNGTTNQRYILSRVKEHCDLNGNETHSRVSSYIVYKNQVALAVRFMRNNMHESKLLIIDEIGKMELLCDEFFSFTQEVLGID